MKTIPESVRALLPRPMPESLPKTMPELVLPAGSKEHLKAAIFNGADAVYLGAKKFSARANAANFETSELKEAVTFCHDYGKKAYLTINTLITDSEMGEAIDLAKQAYLAGIDAVIVQDLGLIKALRELLPELSLHASTQMTCHNKQGAEFLASLGMKRIVLARELSFKEIKEIKEHISPMGVQIECFVHGALCFSLSGQCLFSSFAFNKSGNRGRCLQPCRLKYELRSADGKEGKKGSDGKEGTKGYVLSMKDLITINNIPELIEAGIDAFKVEGRLKDPEYVGSVALAYRRAIDNYFNSRNYGAPSEIDIKRMKMAFSRDPTTGYMSWNSDMVSPDSPAPRGVPVAIFLNESSDLILIKRLDDLAIGDKLSAVNGDSVFEFTIKKILTKSSRPDGTVLIKPSEMPKLEKGQTIYLSASQRLKLPEARPPQKIAMKQSLRKVDETSFSEKKKELLKPLISSISATDGTTKPENKAIASEFAVFVDEKTVKDVASSLQNIKKVICYAQSPTSVDFFNRVLPNRALYFKTPNFQTSSELAGFEQVIKDKKIVCSNLGALQLCIKNKSLFWADRELNVFNSLAVQFMAELGAERIIPSAECSLREIKAMPFKEKIMPLAFFYPLLMTSRAYAKSSELGGRDYVLTDRMGFRYEVTLDDKRILRIYNPVPVDMLSELDKLPGFDTFGIDLRAVGTKDAIKVLNSAKNKEKQRIFKNFTRGHYERDVE